MKMNANVTGYTVTKDGLTVTNPRGEDVKQHIDAYGYPVFKVAAQDNGGKQGNVKTHRFVAFTYIANPDEKPQVNHIDGDKLNNCVTNLEWNTAKENLSHAVETGLRRCSSECLAQPVKGTHVKTGEVIYLSSMTGNEGFYNQHISACCLGKRKTHIGYTWEKVI